MNISPTCSTTWTRSNVDSVVVSVVHRSRSSQKSKRKALPLHRKKSKDSRTVAEPDSIYSDARLQKLDSNLQQLQEFNRLMDKEIHSQLETLVRRRGEGLGTDFAVSSRMISTHRSTIIIIGSAKPTSLQDCLFLLLSHEIESIQCVDLSSFRVTDPH